MSIHTEAVKDLYLLARSKAVLGTPHSSFSKTADLLGRIPLILAHEPTAADKLCEELGSRFA